MNLWEWIVTSSTPADYLTAAAGLTLTYLFATNRIITRGQHLDRIADLTSTHAREQTALVKAHDRETERLEAHHTRELAEKDRHVERVDESRIEWKTAEGISRARADAATATVKDMAEALEGVRHVLESLQTVAKESRHS